MPEPQSPPAVKWADLLPDPAMVAALAHAGTRPEDGTQNAKRHWSETLANACAVAIADQLRRVRVIARKRILPLDLESGTEPLTPLGAGQSKRIDVTVADPVLGLELGVSLKGLNFKDPGNGNFDKNLTGRLYELGDEMRLVHEHLPHAFMAAVFFLPLASCGDKVKGQSSFAHTVVKLRQRTGRLDPSLPNLAPRADAGYVGLYTTGKEPEGFPAGLLRFLAVELNPPFAGRPRVDLTLSLEGMVRDIVSRATEAERSDWSEPEQD